tara:strand:- start:294 stop:530 length:237 start_codon:yes stop_codon:yes gene_type:complete
MTYIATLRGYGNDRVIIEVTGGRKPGRTVVSDSAQSVRQALQTYPNEDLTVIPLNGVKKPIRELGSADDLGTLVDIRV